MLLVSLAFADPLAGTWTLAEPRSAVQARMDAEVERAIANYSSIIQSFARPRVAEKVTICGDYVIAVSESAILVTCDGVGPVAGVFGAAPASWTSPKGELVQITAARDGEAVEVRFTAESGWQRIRYVPAADGTIRVEKVLHAEQLASDLSWSSTYRRAP